jgi:hypothetical protein
MLREYLLLTYRLRFREQFAERLGIRPITTNWELAACGAIHR